MTETKESLIEKHRAVLRVLEVTDSPYLHEVRADLHQRIYHPKQPSESRGHTDHIKKETIMTHTTPQPIIDEQNRLYSVIAIQNLDALYDNIIKAKIAYNYAIKIHTGK